MNTWYRSWKKSRKTKIAYFGEWVETVVLLSKGEIDSKKVKVEFSMEDIFPVSRNDDFLSPDR